MKDYLPIFTPWLAFSFQLDYTIGGTKSKEETANSRAIFRVSAPKRVFLRVLRSFLEKRRGICRGGRK
jgi:hypothetical protein